MNNLIVNSLLLLTVVVSQSAAAAGDDLFGAPDGNPAVTVLAVDKMIKAGSINSSDLEATFEFRVEAEADSVNLTCVVSNLGLKKGATSAVKLKESRGCRIEPANALSMAGQSAEVVEFKNEKHKIDGNLDALKSDYVTFRTIDAERFRQNVFVTVSWNGTTEFRPVGNYEAAVKLVAEIPDNIHPAK